MPLPPPPPAAIQLIAGADLWTPQGPQHGQGLRHPEGEDPGRGPGRGPGQDPPRGPAGGPPGRHPLPGFIEGHAHVGSLGALSREVDLAGLDSLPETLGRIRELVHCPPGGLAHRGRGWDQNLWPAKAFPGARDLDALTGSRPAMLERVDGHAAWVNTAALAIAGIGPETPDPEGGRILKDAQGRPNGILLDAPWASGRQAHSPGHGRRAGSPIQAGLLRSRPTASPPSPTWAWTAAASPPTGAWPKRGPCLSGSSPTWPMTTNSC